MIIVDTNVLSELTKPSPSREVIRWFAAQSPRALYTTAITQAEIQLGIELLAQGRRRAGLQAAADAVFATDFHQRVLPFDADAALAFSKIVAARRKLGRPIGLLDAQIAAIARSRRAVIATRNAADFEQCGAGVVNPWAES